MLYVIPLKLSVSQWQMSLTCFFWSCERYGKPIKISPCIFCPFIECFNLSFPFFLSQFPFIFTKTMKDFLQPPKGCIFHNSQFPKKRNQKTKKRGQCLFVSTKTRQKNGLRSSVYRFDRTRCCSLSVIVINSCCCWTKALLPSPFLLWWTQNASHCHFLLNDLNNLRDYYLA